MGKDKKFNLFFSEICQNVLLHSQINEKLSFPKFLQTLIRENNDFWSCDRYLEIDCLFSKSGIESK
jgi:hypothetical protein